MGFKFETWQIKAVKAEGGKAFHRVTKSWRLNRMSGG